MNIPAPHWETLLRRDKYVHERGHSPAEVVVQLRNVDVDGEVGAAPVAGAHRRDVSDQAVKDLIWQRVEGDLDGLAATELDYVGLAQVGCLYVHAAGVSKENEHLTCCNKLAAADEKGADLAGKGGSNLGLDNIGLCAGELRLGGADAGERDGDIFGRGAFVDSAQIGLRACERGLGGLDAGLGGGYLAFCNRYA